MGKGKKGKKWGKGREKGKEGERKGRGKLRHGFLGMDAPAHRGLYNNFGKTTNAWWAAGGFA